jgi:hypothetical protein
MNGRGSKLWNMLLEEGWRIDFGKKVEVEKKVES